MEPDRQQSGGSPRWVVAGIRFVVNAGPHGRFVVNAGPHGRSEGGCREGRPFGAGRRGGAVPRPSGSATSSNATSGGRTTATGADRTATSPADDRTSSDNHTISTRSRYFLEGGLEVG